MQHAFVQKRKPRNNTERGHSTSPQRLTAREDTAQRSASSAPASESRSLIEPRRHDCSLHGGPKRHPSSPRVATPLRASASAVRQPVLERVSRSPTRQRTLPGDPRRSRSSTASPQTSRRGSSQPTSAPARAAIPKTAPRSVPKVRRIGFFPMVATQPCCRLVKTLSLG